MVKTLESLKVRGTQVKSDEYHLSPVTGRLEGGEKMFIKSSVILCSMLIQRSDLEIYLVFQFYAYVFQVQTCQVQNEIHYQGNPML